MAVGWAGPLCIMLLGAGAGAGAASRSEGSYYGLSLVKRCGGDDADPGDVPSCSRYKYCSDGVCEPCSRICTEGDNNYTPTACEKYCQDYIHDHIFRYLTEADSLKATKDLQDTIEWLRTLVAVSITISCIIAVVVIALLGFMWLTHRRKSPHQKREKERREKKMTSVAVIVNNNESEGKEKSLNLDMGCQGRGVPGESVAATPATTPSVAATMTTTTATPVSRRYPCEDTTLEFAYDNPALTPSPVLNQPRHETTF